MARVRKRKSSDARCWRCGNADDLEPIRDHLYCLPCRTCPHGFRYEGFWDPGCPRCVRDLHTFLTFDGPRIRDLESYVRETKRWGIEWYDVLTWCFAEQDDIEKYRLSVEPFHKWNHDRPPHFDFRD